MEVVKIYVVWISKALLNALVITIVCFYLINKDVLMVHQKKIVLAMNFYVHQVNVYLLKTLVMVYLTVKMDPMKILIIVVSSLAN